WKFPTSTSVPKPLQQPNPPVWIAARDPNTHDFAIANGCNIMVTPLMNDDDEVVDLNVSLMGQWLIILRQRIIRRLWCFVIPISTLSQNQKGGVQALRPSANTFVHLRPGALT